MKRYRFSLMAGLLAIGAAACGDDVQVVEPTPPVPPPPPPLQASMTPSSAEVAVGSSVVFAVNASGGVVGEAATWTCASSNTGIATVTQTSAGCQATGVAAGGVTITASVSKSGETANVGAQLTVTAPPPPPPFEASIAPASQSVAVGSSVVFAVNTSGGYTGMMMGDMMMAASWTCASSDAAIATVETTDAGCAATGVSGGEVTINVAATDGHDTINLVAQLTVTTDPVDPAQPFSATMSPESAEIAVGSSAVFAINTSGGAADATAEWTCSSSDDAIATAETTDAGCAATGVAGGGVTINAAVTKGDDSANLAAQLTVTAPDVGEPAFILLASITDEDDNTAPAALSGRISVQISVERGDQVLEGLSLLVDGEAVAHQSFGIAASPGPAEQAVHEFTLSFDSDSYVVHGDHTDIDYMNGDHTISGELQISDGMMGQETISSNVVTVEFDNPDGFVVDADLGQASMLADDGKRWYGGPLNGHIVISALPVIYSGEEIGVVTVGLAGCEAEEAEGDDNGNGNGDDHHHAAEASFEFDCEGEDAGRAITVAEGGNDGMILNADDLPEANIDMEGPAVAPYFDPNPNNRQNGWVNLTVDFLGEQKSSNENGWLTYNDEGADDAGVGGYQPVLRYAAAGSKQVENALAAAPLSLTNLPTESELNGYCAFVSAADALGNESSLPDEDDGTCNMAGTPDTDATNDPTTDATGYELLLFNLAAAEAADPVVEDDVEAAQEALANAGILAGVDITPPGIEIDEDMRINVVADLSFDFDIYDDENDKANSGLHSLAPLLVRIQRRTTDDTECLDIGDAADALAGTGTAGQVENGDDVSCTADPTALADNVAITFGTTPATSHAYYTLSGAALDQAGNVSTIESHTFVFDATVATATAPAAPGSLEAGESFQIASFLNDDLSIRDYYVTADFGDDVAGVTGAVNLGIVAPTAVDAFNAESLTHRNFSVTADIDTYAGLQANVAATDVVELATVSVAVRDQADSDGTNDETSSAALTVEAVDDPYEGTGTEPDNFTVAFTADEGRLCVAEDMDDCDDGDAATDDDETETELELEVTAGGPGALSDPFERVDFWVRDVNGASWMLGSDTSGESGRQGGTGAEGGADDPRNRTWTYSLDATAANLYMLTREAAFTPTADSDTHTVLAFGVNDDGIALVSSLTLDIDDGESDQ